MAKLGVYFSLCPLIDHRSTLGICQDAEPGNVIVTLGKNIAILYRLHDQKQLMSWRTKDKFSSPVVYDLESKSYIAAFSQTYLRIWNDETEELDKLKKYKFKKQIHTLLSNNGNTYIVFSCGDTVLLKEILQIRKEYEPRMVINEKSESIWDIVYVPYNSELLIGILSHSEKGIFLLWWITNKKKTITLEKLELMREEQVLQGYLLYNNKKNDVQLITLWSDSRIYTYKLQSYATALPSSELFAVVEMISCKHPITMVSLSDDYIAMYGASAIDEGAVLIIYNLQFKVTQSKQIFKLFTMGARLWKVRDNLLVCVGQNLAVVPFRLDTEQIAALVGSHKVVQDENCEVSIVQNLETVVWEEDTLSVLSSSVPEKIRTHVAELAEQGLSENQICEEVIPKYLEKSDVDSLSHCLDYFSEWPEICLAKLLKFCLTSAPSLFKSNSPVISETFPASLQPLERCVMVDKILAKSFSDILFLPHLRSELDLHDILLLFQYIIYLFSEDGHCLPNLDTVETEGKLIEWSCVLLDSNYQRFLLCRDANVKEVVDHLLKIVAANLNYLEDLQSVLPLLKQLHRGKCLSTTSNASFKYSIEQVQLY